MYLKYFNINNRFNYYLYSICVNFEIAYIKYSNKSISEEAWNAWNEGCNAWFMFPGFQKWWKHNHVGGFTKSFKNHVDECISHCNKNPNKHQQNMMTFLGEMTFTNSFDLEKE